LKRTHWICICLVAIATSGSSYACSSSSSSIADAGTVTEDLEDVIYEGGANDEALRALLGGASQKGRTVSVTAPTTNEVVPGDQPFVFAWSDIKQASLDRKRQSPTFGARLRDFLEGTAFAHGESINGAGYFVTFSTADNPKLLRVFTTKNGTVPAAAAWGRMKAAKVPISVRIRAATFEESRLANGGGPFDGPVTTFTIQQ